MKKIMILIMVMLLLVPVAGCGGTPPVTDPTTNGDTQNGNERGNNDSSVKGQYSNEVFSDERFDYKTSYDNAVFTFNTDSTFECEYYEEGVIYKGTYEVYNGLFIAMKTKEIKEDSSINNAEMIADDIDSVSGRMMTKLEDMLYTYLLYLQVDEMIEGDDSTEIDIIQPFCIKYDINTDTGIAVNILGQMQGSFIKQ